MAEMLSTKISKLHLSYRFNILARAAFRLCVIPVPHSTILTTVGTIGSKHETMTAKIKGRLKFHVKL